MRQRQVIMPSQGPGSRGGGHGDVSIVVDEVARVLGRDS
jgi:hypothetical protein